MRSGDLSERELQTGLGSITVKILKVRVKTGEPVAFRSALAPPYARKKLFKLSVKVIRQSGHAAFQKPAGGNRNKGASRKT